MGPDPRRARRDRKACAIAKQYLLRLPNVTPDRLERHLNSYSHSRPRGLKAIYKRLLISAQNKSMGPKVIGPARIQKLKNLLGGFEPSFVAKKYGNDSQRVLRDIKKRLPNVTIRDGQGYWAQFARSITSGASFLSRFESAREFRRWVHVFDKDDRTRAALPMLLKYEIAGFGFPLACDFLKEIGYPNFGKPDVHLKKIFGALELSKSEDDYDVFNAIVRIAKNCGTMPYAVDKLFWLIGSGNFHLDELRIGGHRGEFIKYARRRLPVSKRR